MGMQKVLCRFMCETSAPMSAGRVRPTWALRLAPSMYTWPLLVDHLTDLTNAFFIHPMGRGVGDHQAGKSIASSARLGLEVVEVDVAIIVAVDDHHLHASHLRRCRVGAMRR